MAITLATEDPLQDEIRDLVAELNAHLLSLTPPEHCYHLTVEQMAESNTTVWVARDGGRAVACGALKRHSDRIGEVKRMYTKPEWQGQGIGRRVLGEIVSAATVGVALAGHGGGITAEAADVVILIDDLSRVVEAVQISQRTMRIAKQSIVVGLGLSMLAMVAAAFGAIAPTTGALIQEGIDLAVIFNALRTSR